MIDTGVLVSLRRPQTFHRFVYSQGARSLVPLPQRLLIIATQKGGTAVANTIYPINDPNETDGLFGTGTPAALGCRKAFETESFIGQGPFLFCVGIAEPGAGAARVNTGTVAGAATSSGNAVFRIAGRTIAVGVALGDVAATVATAMNVAINANKANLPVTTAVVGAVVTATHNVKGENGQDTTFETVSMPPGLTLVWAQTVAGAGVADPTTALANALGPEYDAIALENHKAADVALALAHVIAAWGPSEKKWRHILIGETGAPGVATPLAAAANDRGLHVANWEASPSLPLEIAVAAGVALLAKSRPNGNWDGQRLPLYPPPDASVYTNAEIESLLAAGVIPLMPVLDPQTRVQTPNVGAIVKFVTTCTTQSGQPFEALRDVAVPRTGAFIARQLDAAFAARFGAEANPDGVLLTPDTLLQVRDMVANVLYAAQDLRIVTNVEVDLQSLVVEPDPDAPGRINVEVKYTVVLGLHQVAYVHRVTI